MNLIVAMMDSLRVDHVGAYDLQADPDQERNVIADHPDEARRLHGKLPDLIAASDFDRAIACTYERLPG